MYLISAQQAFECSRHFRGRAAIANGPRGCLMQAQRSAHAEVVRIDHPVAGLDLLAFNADVGDPVLPATIRASRHMQLQLLIEAGQTLFQFLNQPSRKTFGLGNRQFAKFGSAACDRAAMKRRAADFQSDRIEFRRQ